MSRYTKTQITQLSANEQAAIDNINKNFQDIQEAIADTVSRSGNVPTHMTADFDLNGKRIINTSAPKTDNDFVRRVDVLGDISTVQSLVNATTNAAAQTLQAAQEVQEIIQDRNVGLVADDLALGDDSKIKQVAENKDNIDLVASLDDDIEAVAALKDDIPVVVQAAEDIDKVEDIAEDITAVASNASNITAVAENEENINAVNANKTNINAVNANKTNIDAVAGNQTNIDAVAGNATNINAVAGNSTNINAVNANATNINAVANNETNIDTVAGISGAVSNVASNSSDVSNVATNMSAVNNCSTNMAAIQAAPSAASSAASSAEQAAISAAGTHFKLFHYDWFDYELNDQSWLKADTFSWQDGTVYSNAYNHLVNDYNGGTSQTETIGSYTITYVLADDGHKITTDETNVQNIYNSTGVAWYYVLDTTNQRFKLPRTKFGFTGLRDTVGKYVPESLPNIKGEPDFQDNDTDNYGIKTKNPTGAFYGVSTTGSPFNSQTASVITYQKAGFFDASRFSSTYQDNAPVQQRATQMYLYFYIGQYSQSATEQTAGLNSSLFNGKVDLDAANLSTTGKSLISGLGMPSYRYIDLTFGASQTQYTMPSNGWVFFDGINTGASNCFVQLLDATKGYKVQTQLTTSYGSLILLLPVSRGDIVGLYYSGVSSTNFRFFYAEGDS